MSTITRILFVLALCGALVSCDKREKESLKARVDSLRFELETTQMAQHTLQEVGALIDSIDANRNLLRTNMIEGTSYENYVSRMSDINHYVKETERKIGALEQSLRASKSSSAAYAKSIKKLKNELEKATGELNSLQELVNNYKNENQNLAQTVSLKDAEITQKSQEIQVKIQELQTLETRVQQMMAQAKVDEGEAYFARAQAVEETAKRTKFAPRKKKETVKEALELYRMALFYGKQEAQDKIAQLEPRI